MQTLVMFHGQEGKGGGKWGVYLPSAVSTERVFSPIRDFLCSWKEV